MFPGCEHELKWTFTTFLLRPATTTLNRYRLTDHSDAHGKVKTRESTGRQRPVNTSVFTSQLYFLLVAQLHCCYIFCERDNWLQIKAVCSEPLLDVNLRRVSANKRFDLSEVITDLNIHLELVPTSDSLRVEVCIMFSIRMDHLRCFSFLFLIIFFAFRALQVPSKNEM